MANPILVPLGAAILDRIVLENLKPDSPSKAFLNDTLTAALKNTLSSALAGGSYVALAALVEKIGHVDMAANKDASVRTFVSNQVGPMVANDPTMKEAIDAEVAKLSDKTTLGTLLGLDIPLKDHPLFQAEVRKADLSSLLGTSSLVASNQLQEKFISFYAEHQGPIQDFWSKLRREPAFETPGLVEDLQFALQLGLLTQNNVPLVKALQKFRHEGTVKSLQDLVKMGTGTWTQLINTPVEGQPISIPPNVPGTTPQEKTANYVGSIMDNLRAAFPTAVLERSITTPPPIDLNLVKAVRARNPQVKLSDRIPSNLDLSGLNADDQARVRLSLEALRQEINMFPGFDYKAELSAAATDARPPGGSTASGAGAAAAPAPFQNPVRQGVSRFLANSQDFDFQTTHIDRYITDRGTAAFQGISDEHKPAITDQLKRLQRVFRVTPKYEEISALLGEGLDSAHRITDIPQSALVRTFQDKLGGEERTRAVYAQAQHVNAGALNFFAQVHQALNDVTPRAIGPVAADVQGVLKQIPDWETLFGSLSFCDCEHCRSVLSPAAYFVDLLQFLKNSGANSAGLPPFDVLTKRRPDLPYIKLTCENTNTPIPYVDLVNEILETYTAVGQFDQYAAKDTGDATADQLSANPEYTNDAAYDKLRLAVYPLMLPFNRPLEVVRTFLQQLGSSWYEVMRTFQKGGDPSDFKKGTPTGLAIACEFLKISAEEHAILTGTDLTGALLASPHTLPEFYGYPAGSQTKDLIASLQPVPELLKRTGISYGDLIDLVKTRFVNSTQAITLDAPADSDPCDLSKTTIKIVDETPLKNIQRFIRLVRKLDWGYGDLDKAIKTLGASDIDDPFLVKLAQLKHLQNNLNLPLDQLLSFWSDIGTDGRGSLYIKLFQNKAVLNPIDPSFNLIYATHLDKLPCITLPATIKVSYGAGAKELWFIGVMTDAERIELMSLSPDANYRLAVDNLFNIRALKDLSDLLAGGELITAHVNTILAALRISAANLDVVRVAAILPVTDPNLTLGNLSILYRHAILARALKLEVKDLISLKKLTGIDPFQAGAPASTGAFVDRVGKVRQSAFSVAQLDYLFRAYDPDGVITPSDDDVNLLFQSLSDQLKKITDGAGSVPGATQNILGQELAALLDSDLAIRIMAWVDRTTQYSAPLANLPNIKTFPDPLKQRITYDPNAKVLRFVGAMSTSERTQLLALSSDANYQTAIQSLYQQPRDFLSTLRNENSRLLASLADALAQLTEDPSITNRFGFVQARLVARTNLVEQVLSDNLKLEPAVTTLLLEHLLKSRVGGPQKAIADFVSADGPAPSAAFRESYRLLHKAALLVNGFKITAGDLQYLSLASRDFANFDLNVLPVNRSAAAETGIDQNAQVLFSQWERLNDLFTLKNSLPQGEILFEIFNFVAFAGTIALRHLAPSPSRREPPPGGITYVDARLAVATGWDQNELDILTGPNGFNFTVDDFRNEVPIVRLQACWNLIQRLGVSAATLFSWTKATSPDANQAQDVKNAVKAKYDDQTWLTVAKSLNDPLRQSSKAALISYLLGNDTTIQAQGIKNSSQLYEYFLIDVDMSACMMTSRIKQAISSVQLFVQRCLMNLESLKDLKGAEVGVAPAAIDPDRWTWMKHYRVWEANRKVFLYPENWIEPELRDDKSSFFKDLESALLQSDITIDTAEQVFLNYVEELDKVARLEISGAHWQIETDPTTHKATNVLHVFARTYAVPHVYYYRRQIEFAYWTPWEKVSLDIEGDHLIPVVYNRRLYLFWPIFTRKAAQVDVPGEELSPKAPQQHWQIQLAWSEYRNGKWSAKKVSTESIRWPSSSQLPVIPLTENFTFKSRISDQGLTIVGYVEQPKSAVTSAITRTSMPMLPVRYARLRDGEPQDTGNDKGTGPVGDPSPGTVKGKVTTTAHGTGPNGIPNVTIFLRQKDATKGRQVTNQYGDYSFENVASGQYDVMAYAPQAPAGNNCKKQEKTEVNVLDSTKTVVTVDFQFYVPTTERYPFADFLLSGCEGQVATSDDTARDSILFVPKTYHPEGMMFVEDSSTPPPPLQLLYAVELPIAILRKAPTIFRLLPPDNVPFLWRVPFFYQDQQHTYAVDMLRSSSRALSVADAVVPPYRPAQLFRNVATSLLEISKDPILEVGSSGVEATAVSPVAIAAPAVLGGSSGARDESSVDALPVFGRAGVETNTHTLTGSSFFSTHYHPHVCNFIKALNQGGVPGLLTLTNQGLTNDHGVISGFTLSPSQTLTPGLTKGILIAQGKLFAPVSAPTLPPAPAGASYLFYGSSPAAGFYYTSGPTPMTSDDALIGTVFTEGSNVKSASPVTVFRDLYAPVEETSGPRENVDFGYGAAYSIYNWELFFHIPLLIADRLSKNQRFEEAQQWFHYIFNPTDSSDYPSPQRYWKVLPFFASTENGRLEDLMRALDYSGNDPTLLAEKTQISNQIDSWLAKPFDPHQIARLRLIAYQKTVVMKYLDNLIAWGDQLFRQNTIEAINEATQLYLLAYEILGPRPQRVPPRGKIQDLTYQDLARQLDKFSNSLESLENVFPFSTSGSSTSGPNLSKPLYFCIPQNQTLLGYWDTVADRLFKIRHCMTIEGAIRQLPLPLFEPPIEPGLLVRAAAMGVDLASALADITAAAPYYRFTYVLQRALELCAEVRALGSALLAALEKKDAEALAALRATQETSLLKAVRDVKQKQLDEANAAIDGLQKTREVTDIRHAYYQTLTGQHPYPYLIENEQAQLDKLAAANELQEIASGVELLSQVMNLIPNATLTACVPPCASATYGGSNLGQAAYAAARIINTVAADFTYQATKSSILGGHIRRADEWNFQLSLAAKELEQIDKQIAAAQIRAAIAQLEIDHHDLQIENASAIEDFLRNKYTNQDLYNWMASQTSTVFFQCYQMGYQLAKRAEACFRFERGLTDSGFISFGYWDNLRKGLLSGEQLYLDLKRMELAYMDQNRREHEITKNTSLVILNPLALIALKETGRCTVSLPEAFFDMDYPGHYMRRIKSMGLTIPCVTGPYTSVNCTVTLLNNKIRVDNSLEKGYADDSHFIADFAAMQSITTSSAQNDSGMFELDFRDERYLPFEGAGVISTWQVDLPRDCNAFDFETISDLIINLKYTAREGGTPLRDAAIAARVMPAPQPQGAPLSGVPLVPQPNLLRFFSLRHEFPTDWYKFLNPADTATSQTMQIGQTIERFPFLYRGRKIAIAQVDLFLKFKDVYDSKTYTLDGNNPTPLGDYVASARADPNKNLTLRLTPPPPGTAVNQPPLLSDPFFDGLPHTLLDFKNAGLGAWSLQADSSDIQKIAGSLQNVVTYHHLKAELIEDILMVCHYSVA